MTGSQDKFSIITLLDIVTSFILHDKNVPRTFNKDMTWKTSSFTSVIYCTKFNIPRQIMEQ